jgi:hypothetical protein
MAEVVRAERRHPGRDTRPCDRRPELVAAEPLKYLPLSGTVVARDELEKVIEEEPTMIAGSMKQRVVHPAITEVRLQRQLLSGLLARLDVPELGGVGWDSLTSSERARKAAVARWRGAA